MRIARALGRGTAVTALAAAVVLPARATTLRRVGLEELTATSGTVVVGTVLETRSYWNAERSFILTDARVAVGEVLKGSTAEDQEITVTLLGGSVDDLTALIVGGAQLLPKQSYVLFLDRGALPGAEASYTLRDHCQGAFDVVPAKDGSGPRAVSQAKAHPLVPDARGATDVPGGLRGLPLQDLVHAVRNIGRKGEGR
jgi:hypothetical protein